MKVHELKTWPEPFQDMIDGVKRFEVRKNDRDFKAGDALHLREWDPATGEYTGRDIVTCVSYALCGEFGLPTDLCVMQLDRGWINDPIAEKREAMIQQRLGELAARIGKLEVP